MNDQNTNETTAVAATDTRNFLPQITCGFGALGAIGIGTALFGGHAAVVALVSYLLAALCGFLAELTAGMGRLLPELPWTILFNVVCGVCFYCMCRLLRAGVNRQAYLISLATGLVMWILYLTALPVDVDAQLEALKGLSAGIVLSWPGVYWYGRQTKMLTSAWKILGISRKEDCAWNLLMVFAVIGSIATAITGLAWVLNSTDTLPDVSAAVEAKYGAELQRMGFEDVQREGIFLDNNACKSLDVEFRDGTRTGVAPPAVDSDVFVHDEGDEFRYASPDCIGMRFRSGHLTMQFPDAVDGARRDIVVQRALATSDDMMNRIRVAYARVEARKEANATWQGDAR